MEHVSSIAHVVTATALLLLVAAGTLAFTKRLRLPFTVILVPVGMAVAALRDYFPQELEALGMLEISPDLILYVFLPALIFESTFNMDVQRLRQNLGPVLALAAPGLLLSTALIGGMVSLVTGLPLTAALLLGAILSATDPVAVIALFKQLGAPKRLVVLVEGESLFNDATAIVVAKILLGVLAAGALTTEAAVAGIVDFFWLFIGGVAVGVVMGWIAGLLLGRVLADALIEISITTATAYLSFLVAEEVLHVSGVMATVGAGLTLGGWGRVKISPPVREYMAHFWEYMVFIANAMIFLLVGMKISLPAMTESLGTLLVVIAAMTLARAAVVFGLVPALGRLPHAVPIDLKFQAVMFWGGLRGAIALAIVLSLHGFEHAELFTSVAMGAVLFTLLVQGLSMAPLMRRLGLDRPPVADRLAQLEYKLSVHRRALQQLPALLRGGLFSGPIAERLHKEMDRDMATNRKELAVLHEEEVGTEEERSLLFLRAFAEERASYAELFAQGHLSETAYRQLLFTLGSQSEALRTQGRFVHIRTHGVRRRLEPHLHAFLGRVPGLASWVEQWRMSLFAHSYEIDWAHYQASCRVLDSLHEPAVVQTESADALQAVEGQYRDWQARAKARLDDTAAQFPEFVAAMQERLGRRMLLLAAADTAHLYAERGLLSADAEAEIQDELRHRVDALRGTAVRQLQVDARELLRKVPFLATIPEQEFAQLAKELHAHTLVAGEAVVRQGEVGDSLYLIARGVMRVSRSVEGRSVDLATLMAGDFFGEMALLHDMPRTATVTAVTPCAIYELNRKQLQGWMQSYPDIGKALAEADREHQEHQQQVAAGM